MSREYVSVAREGRVAVVTFDRGTRFNPLSLQAIDELTGVARELEGDLDISAVILTTPPGSGFSAGRDLADPAMENRRSKPLLRRRHAAGAGKRLCAAAWESPRGRSPSPPWNGSRSGAGSRWRWPSTCG